VIDTQRQAYTIWMIGAALLLWCGAVAFVVIPDVTVVFSIPATAVALWAARLTSLNNAAARFRRDSLKQQRARR
jgi:hypothetical protein